MPLFDALWQDLRYAVRVLRKSPGFSLVAILSLALGIGANTAVFTVVHAVLLRSLPYPEPGQLVRIAQRDSFGALSMREYDFAKEHGGSFASVTAWRGGGDHTLVAGSNVQWIHALAVSRDFFRTLSVPPVFGREFTQDETRPTGPRAIILTDALWRSAFGADPSVIGRSATLDGVGYTVVGVLPRGFWFPDAAAAFVPLRPTGGITDGGLNTSVMARLRPGVSVGQAAAELDALSEDLRRIYKMPKYQGLIPIDYQRWLVGDLRLNLLLLFGAVALLLVIGCSNLASLLLARLAVRHKEIAVRVALGSGRARLLRQFLMENMLLALGGGIAGALSGQGLLRVLLALIPFDLPASSPVRVDGAVLAFTMLLALLTGLVFSLTPLNASARLNLHEALKAAGRSAAGAVRHRTRDALVLGEVALSVTLLVAAALLIQSLYRMQSERLGFKPEGLTSLRTAVRPDDRRDGARLWSFESTLMAQIAAIPGVQRVAATSQLPFEGPNNLPTQRENHPEQSIGGMELRFVTPGYFETMGIPVLRGRDFTQEARQSAPVALVNETLAKRWWGNGSPLGDRVQIGRFQGRLLKEILDAPREVVGVVGDTKSLFLKEAPLPTIYIPAMQVPDNLAGGQGAISWVVESTLAPNDIRRAIAAGDSRLIVTRLRPLRELVASTTAGSRFDALLFGIFAGLALVLTAVGIYGLLSFSVARRTAEIGTRMALGASRGDVLALVLRQGLGLVGAGLAVGLGCALLFSRLLTKLLFGVRPADPVSFAAVAGLLLSVGALASYLPARRATRIDPMSALRDE